MDIRYFVQRDRILIKPGDMLLSQLKQARGSTTHLSDSQVQMHVGCQCLIIASNGRDDERGSIKAYVITDSDERVVISGELYRQIVGQSVTEWVQSNLMAFSFVASC